MKFVVICLAAMLVMGCIAAAAHWIREWQARKMRQAGLPVEETTINPVDMECCGQHEVCEKDSLLAAISKEIEYYDDEELDRFRGLRPEEYSEEEEEEFRNILYTMRDDEVAGWVRSLQLRQIELPAGVKDEVLLIVGERRQ